MNIEKNIPIPKKRRYYAIKVHIAHQMAAGDSIFFEEKKAALNCYAILWKNGSKPVIRNLEGGFRVWCGSPLKK